MNLEDFIKLRDIKVRNYEHLRVIKYFYPYLRSVSGDEQLLPSVLGKLLGIDLIDFSVITACFNGVNDDSQSPYDNVDLYIRLNNGIKVFVYGREQKPLVELKDREYVICFVVEEITEDVKHISKNHILLNRCEV